ncbi:hypothetical protein [Acinetobacter johnsonii]|uniref:hypothetical protein n=1 Tax=Acinetobacter johnsonii TaxID=40214 RepID=UPI002168A017|nr:hypothetical protein [Acinetobacter johnsonii]MCS3527300.1 type IV pilus biogenesis protein CpaD/CtpE [Acinetobacter johnsonii]MDH2048383.1 hypothetical protein [Acinetobacter johnsonii]MDN5644774.1 hypothetical protein [Acinetobacter sp.]
MINMKMALVVLASAMTLSLAACSDKKQETEQTPVESSATETPVTNIEVSPEMIDAAPLESEEAGASAPVAASEAK